MCRWYWIFHLIITIFPFFLPHLFLDSPTKESSQLGWSYHLGLGGEYLWSSQDTIPERRPKSFPNVVETNDSAVIFWMSSISHSQFLPNEVALPFQVSLGMKVKCKIPVAHVSGRSLAAGFAALFHHGTAQPHQLQWHGFSSWNGWDSLAKSWWMKTLVYIQVTHIRVCDMYIYTCKICV